ncbi:MAG: hypothetical protein SGJ20_20980 [Planctomycetota bacterium]|nr:hypothetical protein [Planctomycetota bacterium]
MDAQLASQLKSPDAQIRLQAAERLMNEPSLVSATVLLDAVADSSEEVREAIVAALENLETPDAGEIKAIAERLQNPSANVAYWAATLLGRCSQDAAVVLPAILQVLQNRQEPEVQERLVLAIERIGPGAKPALAVLQKLETSSNPRLQRLVASAMQAISGG